MNGPTRQNRIKTGGQFHRLGCSDGFREFSADNLVVENNLRKKMLNDLIENNEITLKTLTLRTISVQKSLIKKRVKIIFQNKPWILLQLLHYAENNHGHLHHRRVIAQHKIKKVPFFD